MTATPEASPPRAAGPSPASFDIDRVRRDFPILSQEVHGRPLVYLDNAATAQKPGVVIDTLRDFLSQENANIHRGVHYLSHAATMAYDRVRATVRAFINAREDREIIFVRGTTEAINLVAQSFGRQAISAGDEIILTEMEHHSNIVPWQLLAEQVGAVLKVVPISECGELDLDAYQDLFTKRTKMVAVVHISNAIGTVNPISKMTAIARERGVPVLVDGAQAVPHIQVDVQELDCDFYAFSGHKMFGPTGVGVLYGRAELLEQMPPYQGGGGMINQVSFEETTFAAIPTRFEAGTPAIAEVIALEPAITYLEQLGFEAIIAYEDELLNYATAQVMAVPGVSIIGTASEKTGVLSFILETAHPHDVGTVLDQAGVAVRAGHHCCQPVMTHYGIPATVRASFALYNTHEDADALVRGLHHVNEMFG